jgi:hypothetical protein
MALRSVLWRKVNARGQALGQAAEILYTLASELYKHGPASVAGVGLSFDNAHRKLTGLTFAP